MLVFDELPLASVVDEDGTIDAELFPNLAGLAAESTWFRNATTVSSSTWHAAPALVTGQLPDPDAGPFAADHPDSLFTLLADDYDLNVVESVTRVCPTDVCDDVAVRGVPGGLRELLRDAGRVMRARLSPSGDASDAVAGMVEEGTSPEPSEPSGEEPSDDGFADFELDQPARFRAFTDGIVDDRPALHSLHVLLPHVPYRYLPSGAQYPGPDPDLGRNGDQWTREPWPVDLGRQRHLLQVGYVDAPPRRGPRHLAGARRLRRRPDRGDLRPRHLVPTRPAHPRARGPGPGRRRAGRPGVGAPPREAAGHHHRDRRRRQRPEHRRPADHRRRARRRHPLGGRRAVGAVGPAHRWAQAVPPERRERLRRRPSAASWPSRTGPSSPTCWRTVSIASSAPSATPCAGSAPDPDPTSSAPRSTPAARWRPRWWTSTRSWTAVRARCRRCSGPRWPQAQGVESGDVLAVAVNGVVGGTSPAMATGDGVTVAVVVSDELFRDGANEITVHRIGAG